VVPSHSPHPRPNELFGVSGALAIACKATGYYVNFGGATRTLIESGTASAG